LRGEKAISVPDKSLSINELKPARILIVDDEAFIQEILVRKLTLLGYICDSCGEVPEALDRLAGGGYDLVLADILMPRSGGLDLLSEANSICPDTAIIMVTGVVNVETAVESLKHGAYDYIAKPFNLEDVSFCVARALEKRRLILDNREYRKNLEELVTSRTQELKRALDLLQSTYHSTLFALGTALDSRDADVDGHSLRVTLYTEKLSRLMGVNDTELRVIEQGALLHDIGKIGVSDHLLLKPDKLTEEEWILMRKHPEVGSRILSGIRVLQGAKELVVQHQERYDGKGYPAGLKGEEIVLGARIFAVADTLDCVTSDRPFQAAVAFEAARDEIIRVAGTQLDPWIVDAFMQIPLEEWRQIRSDVVVRRRRQNQASGVMA